MRCEGVGPAGCRCCSAAMVTCCAVSSADEELGSHNLFFGEVDRGRGRPPTEVLRMEDTSMHYGG